MSSSWIVTAATLFRLIAVAAPMKSRILITRNLAYLTLTVIFGFSLVSIIPIYANMNIVKVRKDCTTTEYETFNNVHMSGTFMQKIYTPGMIWI